VEEVLGGRLEEKRRLQRVHQSEVGLVQRYAKLARQQLEVHRVLQACEVLRRLLGEFLLEFALLRGATVGELAALRIFSCLSRNLPALATSLWRRLFVALVACLLSFLLFAFLLSLYQIQVESWS